MARNVSSMSSGRVGAALLQVCVAPEALAGSVVTTPISPTSPWARCRVALGTTRLRSITTLETRGCSSRPWAAKGKVQGLGRELPTACSCRTSGIRQWGPPRFVRPPSPRFAPTDKERLLSLSVAIPWGRQPYRHIRRRLASTSVVESVFFVRSVK